MMPRLLDLFCGAGVPADGSVRWYCRERVTDTPAEQPATGGDQAGARLLAAMEGHQ